MASLSPIALNDGRFAHLGFTNRYHGNLAPALDAATLTKRRRQISNAPWTSLNQVHGTTVVQVETPGDKNGTSADAAFTTISDATLSVHSADCAPVVFVAEEGLVGVAHAGWRGIEAGVLETTIGALRQAGGHGLRAFVGPCIHPECYEFSASDLERLSLKFGEEVVASTSWGTPALDVPAAIAFVLAAQGVNTDFSATECTACGPSWYSYRARSESARQAAFVRIAEPI